MERSWTRRARWRLAPDGEPDEEVYSDCRDSQIGKSLPYRQPRRVFRQALMDGGYPNDTNVYWWYWVVGLSLGWLASMCFATAFSVSWLPLVQICFMYGCSIVLVAERRCFLVKSSGTSYDFYDGKRNHSGIRGFHDVLIVRICRRSIPIHLREFSMAVFTHSLHVRGHVRTRIKITGAISRTSSICHYGYWVRWVL